MADSKNPQIVLTPDTQTKTATDAVPYTALAVVAGIIVPGLIAYGLGTISETIVIAMVIAVLALVAMIARPFWGLVLFTALLYIRPEDNMPALADMHFTLLVAIITLIGMLLHMMLHRIPLVRSPFIGMMTGFVICGILSGAVAGVFSAAVTDFARLLVLMLLILNLMRTPARYQAFLIVLIVFTAYLSLYSIYLFSTGVATIDSGIVAGLARARGTGIFSDPNDLAATIIAGAALTAAQALQQRRAARVIYLVLLGIMIWAILLTNSRGGLLALLVVISGFCLVFSRRKALATGVAAVLIGAALVAAPGRMKDFDNKEESANMRFVFWEEGLTQLRMHPLTGVGYNRFPDVNGGYVSHNSYVTCFAELGFPAYFFWMGGIYLAFRRRSATTDPTLPVSNDLIGARIGLLGYLAAAFWISRTYAPNAYVFLCLPIAQQFAVSDQQRLPSYESGERQRVYGGILAFCMAMLLLIRMMVGLQ
jgi:O-antigen ligase